MVRAIAIQSMTERADELIRDLRTASDNDALVRRLKSLKHQIFFRVSLITNEKKVLYDSHTKRVLGTQFSQEYVVNHPEVNEAFEKGLGYQEDYSKILDLDFIYVAKAFDFHGKTYVIRTAFPFKYFNDLARDTELGFLSVTSLILLFFSLITWFIMSRLTSPIRQITEAVSSYEEETQSTIPEIHLKPSNRSDEFSKLASTLNSLSSKIQKNIDTLTEERNQKQAILESLVEGVIATDKEMHVTYVNAMALKMMGKSREELIGRHFSTVDLPNGLEFLMRCQQTKGVVTDTITITKRGVTTYFDIVAVPLKQEKSAVLVMQDKSAHYKLLEMRKDFIANASHELKTPITIIRGFAETLHDNPSLPQKTTEEITGKIMNNCMRMTTLIRDLLTLSDVDNIPLSRLIECDLNELILTCCDQVRELFPDAQIAMTKEPKEAEMTLLAEPYLMEMALKNLIENAAKYSTPPAKIAIHIEKEPAHLKITIADQGIGIPHADQERIFERFYTVDKARSQRMGGSGLGLSIVQTIIHKHFGQISVVSEPGKGSTFTILLPVTRD